jgi:hypothetical protein
MAVTLNAGLESPDAEFVTGWIARLKRDFDRVDGSLGNAGMLQLLANPRFQVWQRQDRLGITSWSATFDYTADRWQISFSGGAAMTVSRLGTFAGGAPWELRATYTHAASQHGTVEQMAECWPQLRGRTLSLRLRVATSTPNAVRAVISDGVGSSFSPYHAGDGQRWTWTPRARRT